MPKVSKKDKPVAFSYEALVDELGDLKAELCKMQEREQVIKTLLSSSGRDVIRGNRYQATVSHGERVTLDSERVKEILTPDQILRCSRVTHFTMVRCGALNAQKSKQ